MRLQSRPVLFVIIWTVAS